MNIGQRIDGDALELNETPDWYWPSEVVILGKNEYQELLQLLNETDAKWIANFDEIKKTGVVTYREGLTYHGMQVLFVPVRSFFAVVPKGGMNKDFFHYYLDNEDNLEKLADAYLDRRNKNETNDTIN